jgi:hypothetical protein
MDIKDVISRVESSDSFKYFIKAYPENYLVHIFRIADSENKDEWQVGYYSKKTDKVTIFEIADAVKILPPEEVFKEKDFIALLDLSKVNISFDDALQKSEDVVKKYYTLESFTKAIALLQNISEFGQIWNMTLITMTFSVINVKINASNGETIKHTRESLLGWKKE